MIGLAYTGIKQTGSMVWHMSIAYIFVCDDDIFPDLCILVNNTVPSTKITNYVTISWLLVGNNK